MGRRAKSSISALQILLGLFAIGALVAGGWLFLNHGSDPHATTPTLDVNEFRERSASMEGNAYKFFGTVQGQLSRSEQHGRLLHVTVKKDDGSIGEPVGIQLPAPLDTQNIQKGQDFLFVVEVTGRGMLLVTAISKI